jgi:hypothetical protein
MLGQAMVLASGLSMGWHNGDQAVQSFNANSKK